MLKISMNFVKCKGANKQLPWNDIYIVYKKRKKIYIHIFIYYKRGTIY